MTTFTMRYVTGHFVVTGPDVPPMKFKSRAKARDRCKARYPGSPIKEIGRDASSRVVAVAKGRPRKANADPDADDLMGIALFGADLSKIGCVAAMQSTYCRCR